MDMRKEAEELDRRAGFIHLLKQAKNGDRVIIPKGMSFDEASNLSQQHCTSHRVGLDYRNIPEMAYTQAQLLERELKQFVKADTDKPMLSLIEPHFVTSLGDILTFGAKKYSIDNWKLCTDTQRYKDALLRHTYAYLSGETLDPESGIEHTACMAFNTMALQWFDNNLKGQENE